MLPFKWSVCWAMLVATVVQGGGDDSHKTSAVPITRRKLGLGRRRRLSQFHATTTSFGEYGDLSLEDTSKWYPELHLALLCNTCGGDDSTSDDSRSDDTGSDDIEGDEYLKPISNSEDPFLFELPAMKNGKGSGEFVLVRVYVDIEKGVRQGNLAGLLDQWVDPSGRSPVGGPRPWGTVVDQKWQGEHIYWAKGQQTPENYGSDRPPSFSIRIEGVRRVTFQDELVRQRGRPYEDVYERESDIRMLELTIAKHSELAKKAEQRYNEARDHLDLGVDPDTLEEKAKEEHYKWAKTYYRRANQYYQALGKQRKLEVERGKYHSPDQTIYQAREPDHEPVGQVKRRKRDPTFGDQEQTQEQ